MMKVISRKCAVTAFDLEVDVSRDGRDRGLWIALRDVTRPGRVVGGELAGEAALLEWPELKAVHRAIGAELRKRQVKRPTGRSKVMSATQMSPSLWKVKDENGHVLHVRRLRAPKIVHCLKCLTARTAAQP